MKRIAAAVLALVFSASAQAQGLPEWMSGCWQGDDGESWTDECWMAPRGGLMLGASRSGGGEGATEWEAMQITLEAPEVREKAEPRLTFWASPGGGERTAFVWQPSDLPGVMFVNLAHDYPQRIRYWREGELLKAEIALADGSEAQSWTFWPVGGE